MRRELMIMAVLLCAAVPVFAQDKYQRDFKREVAFEPGKTLRLNTDKGSVRVTAWDESRVEITARITPPENVDADYGRRAVDGAEIEVTDGGNTLSVRSNFDNVPKRDEKWGGWSRRLPDIHYEIRAPRRLNLEIGIDRSQVTLAGLTGKVTVRSDRTPVNASDLGGEIRLLMDRGQATISGVRGSLEVKTDRTDLHLSANAIEGDSLFEISRGELELKIPATQGAMINAGVGRREEFQSDFPLTMNTMRSRTIEGTINGGGPRLTFQGDRNRIRLRRQ